MKIEQLSFQAFGPYVKRQDIDFASLGEHQLFLLRGATGAGKTVILDALTYALYGKSSGGERGEFERMRTRGVPDELETFVNVRMIIQGKHYEFERRIQVKRKRNGDVNYKISGIGGEYIDDSFYPFFENCTRTALERKAEELIGLTHAQFIQVMILPQGKFEQLLVSKSEEKQEILKTLFQSERWGNLCAKLSERLHQEKRELEQLEWKKEVLMKQIEGTTIEEIEDAQRLKQEQIDRFTEKQKQLQTQWEQKQKTLDIQTQLHQQKQRYDQLQNEWQKLCARQPQIIEQKELLIKQKQLEQLRPYALNYQEALQKLEEQSRNVQTKEEEWKQVQEAYQSQQLRQEEMKKEQQLAEKEKHLIESLEKQVELCHTYESLHRTQLQLEKQKQSHHDHYQNVWNALEQIETTTAQLRSQISQGERELLSYPSLLEEEQQYLKVEEQENKRNQLNEHLQTETKQLLEVQETHKKLEQKLETKQEAYQKMLDQYMSNSASMLAELLKEGDPCPVCGSTHHPNKRAIHKQNMELKVLNDEKQSLEQLRIDWEQQKLLIVQRKRQIKEYQKALEECGRILQSLPQWNDAMKEHLYRRLQRCKGFEKQKQEWSDQQTQLDMQKETLVEQAETIQKQIEECEKQLLICKTKKEALEHQLSIREEALLRKELEHRKQAMLEKEQSIQEWQTTFHELELSQMSISSAYEQMQKECVEQKRQVQKQKQSLETRNPQGWALETILASTVSTNELERSIRTYEEQMVQIQTLLQELETQWKGKQLQDLTALQEEVQTLQKQLEECTHNLYDLHTKANHHTEIIAQWKETLKMQETKLMAYTKHSEFVTSMRGDKGIGIERYVLSVMLSNITAVANQLLAHVHDGRYQLYRSNQTSGKVRKSGLELCVFDMQSQSQRSVVSLSGGEKFLVSLALSLALSTVVQSRNGGISMETMFIDEGFGSLDEQSIADALQLLSSMVQCKSMIGIISHVELLKENIPYGIEVVKKKEGSFCKMLV